MAKHSQNGMSKNGHDKPEDEFQYSTPDIFTTSKGVQVRFIGLNQQRLETLRNAGEIPPVPYREMETDFGVKQKEPLSADDLQTDEEKQQWQDYITQKNKVENQRDQNVMKYTFTAGFEVLDLTDEKLDEWKTEQVEVWGLKLPTNRIDLKLEYINSEVIGNNDDFAEVMAGIMERTGVPPETLDELRATFRNQVRRRATQQVVAEQGVEG